MFLFFRFIMVPFFGLEILSKPIRNKEPPLFEIGLPFSKPFLYNFLALFSFWINAVFGIISTNSHTRHTKLLERNKVLMVHDSVNKKYGSYFKYPKYCAFTLY
jgi:hypothetical protein